MTVATESGTVGRSRSGRSVGLRRLPVLLLAGVALLAGLDAALLLLGLPAPVRLDRLPSVHGTLLVFGFVGTLIALERGVALRHPAGFVAPILFGLGALASISPLPPVVARAVSLAGGVALVACYLPLWRRQRDHAVLIQALGAVLAVGALVLTVGGVEVRWVVGWLAGFLILTIAGERLELARLSLAPGAGRTLVVLSGVYVLTLPAALLWPALGVPATGASLLALVGWLVVHDVARRMVRETGLPRYVAGCLLSGYAWLAVAGAVWLVGPATEGVRYDAVVHAVFLGFTMSMIMAHAPVILPALLRRPLPYRPVLVIPAALLHLSLLLRVWGGDGLGVHHLVQLGGALNIAAVLLFLVTAVALVLGAGRTREEAADA